MDSGALTNRASQLGAAGAPSASAVWQRRSTREVPKADRFDYWRGLPFGNHMVGQLGAHGNFFGEFTWTATADGVDFSEMDIDPCVSRFGAGGDDTRVDIGMVHAGTMHIRHGRDQTLVLCAGDGPVLFDASQSLTTYTSRINLAYLSLPRTVVVATLGGEVVPRGAAVRPLAPGVLTQGLAALLRGLKRDADRNAPPVSAALCTANALALVILANARGAGHRWPGELDAALHRAACHLLALSVADAPVTVNRIAAMLGCSRAQLYRLFAARGETVAGYLYELRMQHATKLLQTRPRVAVGIIAAHCGYSEPIAFDKAFHRRFGMTPTDWRAMRAESDCVPG